jgi:hypothetical protein
VIFIAIDDGIAFESGSWLVELLQEFYLKNRLKAESPQDKLERIVVQIMVFF